MNGIILSIAVFACVGLAVPIEKENGYAFDVKHEKFYGQGGQGGFGGGQGGGIGSQSFGGSAGGFGIGGGFGGGFGSEFSSGGQGGSLGGGSSGGFEGGNLGGGQGGLEGGYHFPSYKFSYGVKDLHTGDIKDAWEHRHGDHVEGEYSLAEADGTHRVVKYKANSKEGFNAVVKTIGKPISGGSAGGSGSGIGGGYGGYSYQKVNQL